jgi:hypothetical protein
LGWPRISRAAVGDDLVGVHVRRRSRAALDHVDDELLAELAVHHIGAGLFDGRSPFGVQQPELEVGAGRCQFHGREAADQVHVAGERLTR